MENIHIIVHIKEFQESKYQPMDPYILFLK